MISFIKCGKTYIRWILISLKCLFCKHDYWFKWDIRYNENQKALEVQWLCIKCRKLEWKKHE